MNWISSPGSLGDEKSLTTSAPQSQRRDSRCLGFLLIEANLLGMRLLPRRKSRGNNFSCTESSRPGTKTTPLTEKRGLIPPEPDVSLTLLSLAEKRCLIPMESIVLLAPNLLTPATSRTPLRWGSSSVLFSMAEHSGYL